MTKQVTNEEAIYVVADLLREAQEKSPDAIADTGFNYFVIMAAIRLGGLVPDVDYDPVKVMEIRNRVIEAHRKYFKKGQE